MFDVCAGCGATEDFVFYRITVKNEPLVYCRSCHSGKLRGKGDVYYGYGSGEHTEENICDPKTGEPIPFSSPRGKQEAMKIAGVVEAGDRVRGVRSTMSGRKHS